VLKSKVGEFNPKQTGKIIGLLSQDAFIDFKKDYETEWNTIEKERQKLMTKTLNKEAIALVKTALLFFVSRSYHHVLDIIFYFVLL